MTKAQQDALDKLNPQQRETAILHAGGLSLPQAMLKVGYKEKYVTGRGPTYLKENEGFMAAVAALTRPVLKKAISSQRRTLRAIARIAYQKHDPKAIAPDHTLKALGILAHHHKLLDAQPDNTQIHLHFFSPEEAQAILDRMEGKGAKRILDVPTEEKG